MPPARHVRARVVLKSLQVPSDLQFCPSCSLWRLPLSSLSSLGASAARSGSLEAPPSSLFLRTASLQARASRNDTTIRRKASKPSALRSLGATLRPNVRPGLYGSPQSRSFSNVSPVTSINAAPDIPTRYKALHEALNVLKNDAANYVNLSALQLALHGLESENPVVRIGVLAMIGPEVVSSERVAKRLARLLLADPLGAPAAWENQLEEVTDSEGRSIIIRYGNDSDLEPKNPLIRTLYAPSRFLQKNNLEILITTLKVGGESEQPPSTESPEEAIFVPLLSKPTATSAFATTVSYPVHRAIVVGSGMESSIAYGRFMGNNSVDEFPKESVLVAINTPATCDGNRSTSSYVFAVDVDLASDAISQFRDSVANSVAYERGWTRSKLSAVSTWLAPHASSSAAPLNPAIHNTITSLLDSAHAAILRRETARLQSLLDSSVPPATRHELLSLLDAWAERAHTELRDDLGTAFASRSWRKLAWWRLPWRVDDVGMITSEALERGWLVDAEKGLVWLAGRVEQAGLNLGDERSSAVAERPVEREAAEVGTSVGAQLPHPGPVPPAIDTSANFPSPTPPSRISAALHPIPPPFDLSGPPVAPPWPQHITLFRARLLTRTIPPLQYLAQTLLLSSATLTLTGASLSALLFASSTATPLAEAGAVAALAAVWSAARVQRIWERARRGWEVEVREEGGRVLRGVEGGLRARIRGGGKAVVDEDGVKDAKRALEAVARARKELKFVVRGGNT